MSQHTKRILFNEIVLDVNYDFAPEEKMVMYYPDGSGYSGALEEWEITSVLIEGTEWIQYLNEKCLDEIILQLSNNRDEE